MKSSHVANNAGFPIYAKVDTERSQVTDFKLNKAMEVGANASVANFATVGATFKDQNGTEMSLRWNQFSQAGFTRINQAQFFRFDYADNSTPFVTIIGQNGIIANSVQLGSDMSVHVRRDCGLYNTVYGKIWQQFGSVYDLLVGMGYRTAAQLADGHTEDDMRNILICEMNYAGRGPYLQGYSTQQLLDMF